VKLAARLLLLAGALVVGFQLLRGSPRSVTLIYVLGEAPPESLEVAILRDGNLVRRAVFRTWASREQRHPIRLPDGDYQLQFRLVGLRGERAVERRLQISEDGTVVIPLAE
jgi:hypothetical protein